MSVVLIPIARSMAHSRPLFTLLYALLRSICVVYIGRFRLAALLRSALRASRARCAEVPATEPNWFGGG